MADDIFSVFGIYANDIEPSFKKYIIIQYGVLPGGAQSDPLIVRDYENLEDAHKSMQDLGLIKIMKDPEKDPYNLICTYI